MPDHRRLAILIRHRKAAHVTLAQMACACGLEGSRAYESVSAWERGEARGDVGRSDAAPVQGVAARREGRAARGVRGKRGARREARGKRGARREARGATIRCRVAGRPALVASFLSPRPTRAQPRCAPIIPFIAGQWSLRGGDAAWQRHAPRGRSRAAPLSLSPSLRGSGRFSSEARGGEA